jgi:hypothetical protein
VNTLERVRATKESVARSRIAWLESIPKPTKRDREQLAAERQTLARATHEEADNAA